MNNENLEIQKKKNIRTKGNKTLTKNGNMIMTWMD